MDEYIERDKALSEIDHSLNLSEAYSKIAEIYTADVVEVVRCKDCKYHRPGTGFTFIEDGKHQRYCSCEKWGRCVLDEDFCSYGKRKEG